MGLSQQSGVSWPGRPLELNNEGRKKRGGAQNKKGLTRGTNVEIVISTIGF